MKIYLAAYETQFYSYRVEFPRDWNLFCTYFYANKTDKTLSFLAQNRHRGLITIDSGAHSFFGYSDGAISATGHKSEGDMPDPEEYFRQYLRWIVSHYDQIDYFVELDIQEIVGQDTVDRWRSEMQAAGVYEKCIPVHHSSNDAEHWTRLIAETPSRYIGVEGIRSERPMLPYKSLIKEAYDKRCRVHCFAFTRFSLLYRFPFFSVDSSSWTAGIRYGKTPLWAGNKMHMLDPTKEKFMKHGIPVRLHSSLRSKDDNREKLTHAACQYAKMEKHMRKVWEMRGVRWPDTPTNRL